MPAITLGLAIACSLLLMPLIRGLSLRWGKVAQPREDRWHRKPTAVLGGVGIFLAFALALGVAAIRGVDLPMGILAGSAMLFFLGLYDDFYQISPPAKLLGQILAASAVIFLGYTTNFFTPRIANNLIAQVPNILLSFVWLVGITNAINLLDNMDGLAGGISLITAGFLGYFFWRAGNTPLLLVSLSLAGGILGFLFFNFPPAKIFMGDSGSLFIGFTLALLAIARQPQASNVFAVMGVPTLLFLLPILDTTLVTFTRLLRGQSPAQGGRDHTSHRLIAFGLSERQAVLVLYAMAVVSGVLAASLESMRYWFSLIIVPVVVISLALLTAYLGGLKVVSSQGEDRSGRGLSRLILELTFRRRILEIVLDFFLISLAYYLAFLTRYGFMMTETRLSLFLQTLPIALAGSYLAFYLTGVYRGVWRYVGLGDFLRYVRAALASLVIVAAGLFVAFSGEIPAITEVLSGSSLPDVQSPVLYLLFAVFLLLGLAATRSSFRIMDQIASQQVHGNEQRVIIWGAGDEGEMALRWIQMNPQLALRAVGFLDDDPFKFGRQIHGISVLGNLEQLEYVLEQGHIDGLILTSPALLDPDCRARTLATCLTCGCWVRSLRLEFEPLE